MAADAKTKDDKKVLLRNKKARHDFFVEWTVEAGLALQGSEVKSLRDFPLKHTKASNIAHLANEVEIGAALLALDEAKLLVTLLPLLDAAFQREQARVLAGAEAETARKSALEAQALLNALDEDDLLVVTADHGCDPTWHGSDHTRERVPILIVNGATNGSIGVRDGFADIGATVARHLELGPTRHGQPF